MINGKIANVLRRLAAAAAGVGMMLLSGCEDAENEAFEPRLVVEGTIDSGGYPEVFLTLSASAEGEGSVNENVVRWGVVTVSDGEREVILTGGPEGGMFPPYKYYSFDLKGVAGRDYTLTAEYKGMCVRSSVRMPEPTVIDEIRVDKVAGNEGFRRVAIGFTAPDDCPAYYHVLTKVDGEQGRFYPSMLGAVAVMKGGERVEMPVYRGKSGLSTEVYEPNFRVGERVMVRLARVSAAVFEFWRAWDNATLTEGSIFVGSAESLPGNVTGGYGVWSAQGVDDKGVVIE